MWNQRLHPQYMIQAAHMKLHEWQAVRDRGTNDNFGSWTREYQWHPPLIGVMKCNIDACFNISTNTTSFGCCIRDSNGHFVSALLRWEVPMMLVYEGVAFALLTAYTMGPKLRICYNVALENTSWRYFFQLCWYFSI